MARERLTYAQFAWLRSIDADERNGEPGNDLSGDLSLHTGNYPATHYSLTRRGLVTAEYDPDIHPEDGPWLYHLTDKGREALAANRDLFTASTPQPADQQEGEHRG